MFEGLFRFCTGETLEIAQEMSTQNGDASMMGHDETATAIILHHSNEDDELTEKKLKNSRHKKSEKVKKMKKKQEHKPNFAR